MGMTFLPLPELLRVADVITLHCPLTPASKHLIGEKEIGWMKQGAMIINTSRSAVLETKTVIEGLKSGKIGNLGLDVYEEEANITITTITNLSEFERTGKCSNAVTAARLVQT
jgi:D-lactate dehydrogenase